MKTEWTLEELLTRVASLEAEIVQWSAQVDSLIENNLYFQKQVSMMATQKFELSEALTQSCILVDRVRRKIREETKEFYRSA